MSRELLQVELAAVECQLGRIDSKAALLLGLAGAGATAGPAVIVSSGLPSALAVVAWLTVSLFALAAAVLALAVRPALRLSNGRRMHGFVLYAIATPETAAAAVVAAQAPERLAARLVDLSCLAVSKYRRIRIAVDLMLAGLILAGAGALLALAVAS